MVNLRFFKQEVGLEDFYLEGPGIISGLSRSDAHEFADEVLKGLDGRGCVSFSYLIDFSAGFLEGEVKEKYSVLNKYLLAAYERKVDEPFFIFVGGAASSGKDLLVSDFQHYLGFFGADRSIPADLLRETARTELLKEYGVVENVPEESRPLFEALYRLSEGDAEVQVDFVRQQVSSLFVNQALRECETWVHPFYVLFGTPVMPDFENCVEGNNKLSVILNPSEPALVSRVYVRQERERGVCFGLEEEGKREVECESTIRMRNYILRVANEANSAVISLDDRMKVLHKFGEHLIGKLEGILREKEISF